MSARALVALAALAAASCAELVGTDDVTFERSTCGRGPAPCGDSGADLVVETQNLFLYGLSEPYRAERRPHVEAALRASRADVLCLTELGDPTDRDSILAAVASDLPYAYAPRTNANTPVSVPEDLRGNAPAPPGPPLCEGLGMAAAAGLDCLAQHCSSIPGSGAGMLTDDDCAASHCDQSGLELPGKAERLCAQCLRALLDDHTIDATRGGCEAPPGDRPLGHSGDHATVLLSRHPLSRQSLIVLPSTAARQVLLVATVEKPGLPPVDVACTRFTSNKEGAYDYYVGPYGGGADGLAAWDNEVLLQALRVSERLLAARPHVGVLMGWMGASREVKVGGEVWVGGFRSEALRVFDGGFVDAVSPTFTGCTACLSNPLFDDTYVDRRPDQVFLLGLDRSRVVDVTVTNQEAVVPVTPGPRGKGASRAPISDHYGLRVGLRVR